MSPLVGGRNGDHMSRLEALFSVRREIARHDHWYEWSDSGRVWGAGQAHQNAIAASMVKNDIQLEEVADLIPDELLTKWQRALDYQIRVQSEKKGGA